MMGNPLNSKTDLKDLVRNPLGIVALFISLIYGIAGLLLGTTVSSLTHEERFPLIIFVVLFPIVVLGVFYRLVSRHHGKLYAPGDYKDDKSFLRTLSPAERQEKLELELVEAQPLTTAVKENPALVSTIPDKNGSRIDSPVARSGASSGKSLPIVEPKQYIKLRQAENAAIDHLSKEFGLVESRDIGFGETGASFDAMFRKGSTFVFAEVKFLGLPARAGNMLDRVLYNAVVADKYLPNRSKFVILVVHDLAPDQLEPVASKLRRQVEQAPVDAELRFLNIDELDLENKSV